MKNISRITNTFAAAARRFGARYRACGISYSFTSLIDAWNVAGISQAVVERVSWDAIENYDVADLNGEAS